MFNCWLMTLRESVGSNLTGHLFIRSWETIDDWQQVIDNLISIFLSLVASLWAEIICISLSNVVNIRSKAVPLYKTWNCFMEAFHFLSNKVPTKSTLVYISNSFFNSYLNQTSLASCWTGWFNIGWWEQYGLGTIRMLIRNWRTNWIDIQAN